METKLGRDVFLALAAVAWSDGELHEDEADAIVRAALEEGLDIDEIADIEKATKEPIDIGDVELGNMSKADRLFVYAVASWITRVDGVVHDEELDALDRLGIALRIPERPREHADAIALEVGNLGESEKAAFYNLPKLRTTLKARLAEAQKLRAEQKGKSGSAAKAGSQAKAAAESDDDDT